MATPLLKLSIVLFMCVCTFLAQKASAALVDGHESCEFWASVGECDQNPGYMLEHCAKACAAVTSKEASPIPDTFYDIVEKDIDGREFSFAGFRGKVVYLVNVASQCGYTQSNYAEIRDLQRFASAGLEIVLAPCNAFGAQEPGAPQDIKRFAAGKGYEGIILSKDEVNGHSARPAFRYLKQVTGKSHISWSAPSLCLL